jgi:hypothetical protein
MKGNGGADHLEWDEPSARRKFAQNVGRRAMISINKLTAYHPIT